MNDATAVLVPQANPNDDEAVLVEWHVANGTLVAEGATLATLETTKAAFDVHAPRAGYAHFGHPPKSVVRVGAAIAWITPAATPPAQLGSPRSEEIAGATTPGGAGALSGGDAAGERCTRKALRRLRERGIDPTTLPAGPERVTLADVERWLADGVIGPQRVLTAQMDALEQSAAKVAEVRALSAVYDEVVPSAVSLPVSEPALTATLRALAEAGAPSVLELVVHTCASMLAAYPALNGWHADGRAWRHRRVAIGFALNFGRGLRVPVVHDASTLPLRGVVAMIRDLTLKYARGELRAADLERATFTVTDLSGVGVTHFVPVIGPRQSAILGVCAPRPGTDHRDLVLAFDHRMSDGAEAAAFLTELRDRLESGAGRAG